MLPLVLLLTCLSAANSSTLVAKLEEAANVEAAAAAVSDEAEAAPAEESFFQRVQRQSFFAQFARVLPNNCSSTDGLEGVCKTQRDCENNGGEVGGTCNQAFAVCCVYSPPECGSTLRHEVGYLQSEDYPNAAPEGVCTYAVAKHSTDVVQLKIEFEDVELTGPTAGECANDTMTIVDVDYPNIVRRPLCGSLTDNDPIYISVESMAVDSKIIFNVQEGSDARWKLKITQLKKEDAVPPLCLKYMTEEKGVIRSFNHQDGVGEWLGNMNYATCIKMKPKFCDISFTANHFDIGDGKLCFGTECMTGSDFPASLIYNCTNGPYVFPYMSGDTNDDNGSGYELTYQLLPN